MSNYELPDLSQPHQVIYQSASRSLIYAFYYRGELQYIGRSRRGLERPFEQSGHEFLWDELRIFTVAEDELDAVEQLLISRHSPKHNVQHVVQVRLSSLPDSQKPVIRSVGKMFEVLNCGELILSTADGEEAGRLYRRLKHEVICGTFQVKGKCHHKTN